MPVAQVVWARYCFQFALLLPLLYVRYGKRIARYPARPGLQLLRGLMLLGSTVLFFAAIAQMPIADALALLFIAPIVVTALAPWVLGEQPNAARWLSVGIGFVGVCVILRPGFAFNLPGIFALFAGIVFGGYLMLTRILSVCAPAMLTLGYGALVGTLVTTLWVPFVWTPPTSMEFALMACMGGAAGLAHYLILRAFEHADASLLAPVAYAEMVTALVLGYVLFGDIPEPLTWLGIVLIVASAVYVTLRGSHAAKPAAT